MVAADNRELDHSRMRLSVIVPTLDGNVPESLRTAVAGRSDVDVVVVAGVSPVGKARNEGLCRAVGDYIAWVDADDEVTEDWLPSILTAIEAGPDLVTFDAVRVGWGADVKDMTWGERRPTSAKLMRAVYNSLDLSCNMWAYVTKRTLWQGLAFDEQAAMAEDFALAPQLFVRARTIAYVPQKLYRYISNAASLVHRHGFTGDVGAMELKRRRAAEAPRAYRSAAALGQAIAGYGVAIRVAHGFAEFQSDVWRREAQLARQYVRRNLARIVGECLWHTRLPLREKVEWVLRFVWNSLPEGLARRLVRRG